MATKKMLIDSTHAEETRVVIVNGNRLEDFDVEVASKRQLKSNIYLAKVTRVEPSLQAAFVDFGGNRHGFLSFNEIHPDYYQIPVADREALIAEEMEASSDEDDVEGAEGADSESTSVESVGGDDLDETENRRPIPSRRNYKIQEVVKRRQILLVQVVKEERGNKGAALTTYISLPGRYCVLMPNTARGGGISRKISNTSDRRRLKTILNDLEIPKGIAVIVRTAGSKRTKAEIKRDYDYLMRLWNQVRETTLESIAPCPVYEEGNLIKRAIRDLYTKDIEEVVVEGTDGYRVAKDFMKLLIPSHAKRVQPYKEESVPLFHDYQVESQLDAIHDPVAPLKSGGYLVINQTEALVAIDVNSGKATRERNIEETALHTNLEAASEVARQLRLRDLAGLVVIDFIDMEIHRNQTKVERQLKEAMRNDRARIQMGRISPFGLMELSRQRLRPSLIETSTEPCPHCGGTGAQRSIDSASLSVLRAIKEEGMRGRSSSITVNVATSIALYILNQKRHALADIEARYGFQVMLASDDTLVAPDYRIEHTKDGAKLQDSRDAAPRQPVGNADQGDEDAPRKKRRRRSRRRHRGSDEDANQTDLAAESVAENEDAESSDEQDGVSTTEAAENNDEDTQRKRRRGKRGGRRRGKNRTEHDTDNEVAATEETDTEAEVGSDSDSATSEADATESSAENDDSTTGKPKKSGRKPREKAKADTASETDENAVDEKPKRGRRKKADTPDNIETASDTPKVDEDTSSSEEKVTVTGIPIDVSTPEMMEEATAEPAIAAKTTTIVVGDDSQEAPASRRGWWRR